MRRKIRRCPTCGEEMPRDWEKPYCRICFSRLVISAPMDLPTRDDGSTWDGEPDLSGWTKRPYVPRAHTRAIDTDGGGLDEDAKIAVMPSSIERARPLVFFAASCLSLGIISTLWTARSVAFISGALRRAERVRAVWFYTWLLLHAAALVTAAICGLVRLVSVGLPRGSAEETLIMLACGYFAAAFLMGRSYLFWIRGAVSEATGAPFAPSALLIWYGGAAYVRAQAERAEASGLFEPAYDDDDDEAADTTVSIKEEYD